MNTGTRFCYLIVCFVISKSSTAKPSDISVAIDSEIGEMVLKPAAQTPVFLFYLMSQTSILGLRRKQ